MFFFFGVCVTKPAGDEMERSLAVLLAMVMTKCISIIFGKGGNKPG